MKYNIGDRVKYIRQDRSDVPYNSIGTIIYVDASDDVIPYQVKFDNLAPSHRAKWAAAKYVVKIFRANEQLKFEFMSEAT